MNHPPNALAQETSPYLLQHAHNPVRWLPWGAAALEQARVEDKLLIISVGYSACHWCHVMERESFEDEAVAEVMNEHFVCVKVDREERPDVDQIYMEAVQLMNNGQGGWPLNCFALPDGRPIYGGTYYPREHWVKLMLYLAEFWRTKRAEAEAYGDKVTEVIRNYEVFNLETDDRRAYTPDDVKRVYEPFSRHFDFKDGGAQRVPKFPLPVNWVFVLRYAHFSNNPKAMEAVLLTLRRMAQGGLYDQVGGGFARYSTDAQWFAPHFEKMLYDNAQLVCLYTEAFQKTNRQEFRDVAYETLAFVARELLSPEGGFYSALDADSEGVEGRFYVWKAEEFRSVLGDDAAVAEAYFNVTEDGNWEHGYNILHRNKSDDELAASLDLTPDELRARAEGWKQLLLDARAPRPRPGLDDKILTGWNGLMCRAFVSAYRVFGEDYLLDFALENERFIRQNLLDGLRLHRTWKAGQARINAYLDDYAYYIEALLELYQATFDEDYLRLADDLLGFVLQHYFDAATGLFFYTSDEDPPLIARKKELSDNVTPASNSSIAHCFLTVGQLLDKPAYVDLAASMLSRLRDDVYKHGSMYANWALLMMRLAYTGREVAFCGPEALEYRKQWDKHYFPQVLTAGSTTASDLPLLRERFQPDKTVIYVCQDKACGIPTSNLVAALRQMERL